jgi:hypothetical protein
MDGDTSPQASAAFSEVSFDDLTATDPLKQIPALHKLLFEQFNGKECSHYLDILHKHCLASSTTVNKEVRSLVYAAIKGMTLTSDQWSKLVPFVLNDINGQDMEAKISSVKLFEQMPTTLIIEFFNSGVDLLALGRSMPKSANPLPAESEVHVQLRCATLQSIATLLLYRTDGLLSMKSFCLAGWSLLSDRILYDPSRRVFKVAVESVSTLCAVLYRNSRHRMNNAGMPTNSRQTSAGEDGALDGSIDGLPASRSSVWQNMEPEIAPLTPGTASAAYAAIGSFSSATSANLSVVSKAVSSLEKYGHVVFVKLLPHIYSFVSRCRCLEPCDMSPALMMLSCLLQQLEPLTGEHSNIQVHFMTSPKHLIGEVVDTFLFPLLHSKDESLVFEAASNLIQIAQTDANVNPNWVLAACRALTGLLSRESARSVIKQIVPVLVTSLRLLSPGVLLPVLILVLQHMYKLQLSSAQRLPTFYQLIQIPIQLCDQGSLKPVAFFSAFFKHPWIVSIVNNLEENHFREDLIATVVKSLKAHWAQLVEIDEEAIVLESRMKGNLQRKDSDSDSLSSSAVSAKRNSSKRLSATFQAHQAFGGLHASTGNLNGGLLASSQETISPRANGSQAATSHANSKPTTVTLAKRLRDWREVLYITVVQLLKLLQWRTHVRTYCYVIYVNLVDAVGQSLNRSKSSRPQLRDLLVRVLEGTQALKSDTVALRFHYVIMKHAVDVGNNKLVESLYRATKSRFLAFLDNATQASVDRTLGYRVDQLHKTNLSAADLEVLTLVLHMFSKHPFIADPVIDEERGGSPEPNPRLAATLHYISSLAKYKKDDPVAGHRYARLDQITTSHNLANLLATLSAKSGPLPSLNGGATSPEKAPLSPNSASGSQSAATGNASPGSRRLAAPSPTTSKKTRAATASSATLTQAQNQGSNSNLKPPTTPTQISIPAALDGAKVYVPPIEYLAKEVAEKHPDDDFMITYSKSRLPSFETIDAARQLDRPTTLTSPSDPFIVEAYHIINIEYARITFYLRVTNLTNFQVPKVLVFVDTKGRLEPFNAQVDTHTSFTKVGPGETVLWHTAFKLNSTHVNELMVRLILTPNGPSSSSSSSASSSATMSEKSIGPVYDIQCMPYRINMHIMTLPWILPYSDYLREQSRYVNTTTFKLLLDRSVTIPQLDDAISSTYYRQAAWSYNDTYQLAYSGITCWDERVVFSIYAGRDDKTAPYLLRVELRTSNPTLCTIVDNNKGDWLRDLLPLVPNWFTFASEHIETDSLFGVASDDRIIKAEVFSSAALDEKLMLDQWSKARVS